MDQDRLAEATELVEQAMAVFAARGIDVYAAHGYYTLAQVRHGQGDLAAAEALLAQADAAYSRLGLTPDVHRCRYTLAQVYLDQGRLEEACCRYIQALLRQAEGQWDEAAALLARAETAFRRHGLAAEVARCRYALAEVRQAQRQQDEAITLLGEAKDLFRAQGLIAEVSRCEEMLRLAQDAVAPVWRCGRSRTAANVWTPYAAKRRALCAPCRRP